MRGRESRIVDALTCYEELAEDYDQWEEFRTATQAEEKVLLSLIGELETADILDVGCGTGRYAKRFEDLRAQVVGVDISRKMIRVAKTKTRAVSFIIADASHLPLRDKMFHLVLSALVINHVKDIRLFLRESLRTCRRDEAILISSVWREGVLEVTESIISLYIGYGEGRKGIHVLKAKKA